MRLFVAGASGRTGRLLVDLALRHGHNITAFERETAGFDADSTRVRLVRGDALDPATIGGLDDADAVISLLAPHPRTSGRLYVEGTRNLADAAARAGVRRFVTVSAQGAGVDPRLLPLAYRLVLHIPVVARLYPDIARMETELAARDDLEWTIVRPPLLTNRKATGSWRETVGPVVPGGLVLSRADLAACLLGATETGAHMREIVAIAR